MLKRIKGFLFNFVSGQAWQVFRAKNVPLESAFIAVRARRKDGATLFVHTVFKTVRRPTAARNRWPRVTTGVFSAPTGHTRSDFVPVSRQAKAKLTTREKINDR
jgi:hypothetical protein